MKFSLVFIMVKICLTNHRVAYLLDLRVMVQAAVLQILPIGETQVSADNGNENGTKILTAIYFLSYSSYFNLTDRELNTSSTGTTTTTSTNANQADNANVTNNINDITFRFKNDWKILPGNLLGFGTEITHNQINYTGQRNDTLTVNGNANLYALYLQDKIDITKKIHLLVGYRGDYFQGTAKYYHEPRVSLIYNITDAISLKGAYGKYYQFVSCVTQEDIIMGNSQYWLLDNSSNVPVSYSTHYITGISYENSNFLFNVEGYYKDLTNVLEETSRNTRNFSASNNITAIYAGTGVAKGIDFMLQKKYGNTTGWISYTLGSVIYHFPDLNYGVPFYADQDQTHEFKAVSTQTIKRFDFSATFIYATGKPWTNILSEYQLTMLNGTPSTYYHLGTTNGERYPPYSRFDIATTYNWGKKTKRHLSASVFNLFNHENIWFKEFNFPRNYNYVLNITNVNYLGITPNISFSVDFN